MFRIALLVAMAATAAAAAARADVITLTPVEVTDWKAVYGEVEPRDLIPARARINGTLKQLSVSAGDMVDQGAQIAMVEDDKLAFRLAAIDAQLGAMKTQLATATADFERGQSLRKRGVITVQSLDQLRTAVDVLSGQIGRTSADRLVIEQQVTEGAVLSPVNGVVLSVPVARGSVITAGEQVALIAGGGVFLRLSLPERHAQNLVVGDDIAIGTGGDPAGQTGTLVKVYPQIIGGRVLADVEVAGLDDRFIGRRVPVRLPVGSHSALMVPDAALSHLDGLDFVTVMSGGAEVRRAVLPGGAETRDGVLWREILSGVQAGDKVVTPDE